jgi:hypothetical protein
VARSKGHVVRKNQTKDKIARRTTLRTDVREDMSAETRKHQGNKDPRCREATITEEREDVEENLPENHRAGDREANFQIFCRFAENQELDIVEGPATSETEEGPIRVFSVRRAGNVGDPTTRDSFALPVGKKKGMTVVHRTDWNLKEGAEGTVGQKSPEENRPTR